MPRYREWDLACKVYVGNLGSSASKHEIEGAFAKYGPLRNVWVARNPPGFAFVEFEDRRDAEDATRALDGTRCCGTRIRVEMSSGRSRDRRRGEGGSSGRSGSGRYRITPRLELLPLLLLPSTTSTIYNSNHLHSHSQQPSTCNSKLTMFSVTASQKF
ncbi:RNA-binding protein 1 isoform X2 [Drosophila teissieri]|uniref:RNA-binding protein 1 isoform X2 n=1 Tax=Drosophila teissieri TaxID=7243 RepID=UPI001CBA09C2|nr:RNA-binding protein 1 isoform X2 [Drosophila teissieri]